MHGYRSTALKNKLGVRAADTVEVVLDDLRVPERSVVGTRNEGFYQLMDSPAPALTSAQVIGVSQAALEEARNHATGREQFDRPVAELQAIRHTFAEMTTSLATARSLTYRARRAIETASRVTRPGSHR